MAVIDRRIGILFVAFAALLAVALTRALYLGSFRADTLQRVAAEQQVSTVTIPAPRGAITDRNGLDFAVSEGADDVAADPYLIKDPQSVAQRLAPLLGRPVATVLEQVTKSGRQLVIFAQNVDGPALGMLVANNVHDTFRSVVVRAPGCAPSDFWHYDYRHIPRPLWPWDEMAEWLPAPQVKG